MKVIWDDKATEGRVSVENYIYIVAFWDCRQEPERQTKQVVDNEKN